MDRVRRSWISGSTLDLPTIKPADVLLGNPTRPQKSIIALESYGSGDSGYSDDIRPERTPPEVLEARVENLPKIFLSAAIVAFILAIITVFMGPMIAGIQAESFSRACTNFALLAIGFSMAWKPAKG